MEDCTPRKKRATSIFDLLAQRPIRRDKGDDGDAAPPGAGGPAPAAGGPAPGGAEPRPGAPLLESGRKHCDIKPGEEDRFEVVRCGCRCWFCPTCCVALGLTLRERLVPVLETFTALQMWTLTIDPTLFPSPEAAYQHVKDKRGISTLVRQLGRWGYLRRHTDPDTGKASYRYFCVVEWQKDTQMVHFHLLLETSFIPHDDFADAWGKLRPASAGPVEPGRPASGWVLYSDRPFASRRHAAHYACKYLIKHPDHGYPEWVTGSKDIHRYSTSRGFWGKAGDPDTADTETIPPEAEAVDVEHRTIAERLAACGATSVLMRVVTTTDLRTGELRTERKFVCRLRAPLFVVARHVGRRIEDGQRAADVTVGEAMMIRGRFGDEPTGPPAREGVRDDGP